MATFIPGFGVATAFVSALDDPKKALRETGTARTDLSPNY